MSDHLIAEANRHAKALPKMQLPTTQPPHPDIAWYIDECADLKKQLAAEIEAKHKHLHIACNEIIHLKVKAELFEREIARLRADKELLDSNTIWLTVDQQPVWFDGCDLRKAIRRAMEEKQ